jgi:hypothetical protein
MVQIELETRTRRLLPLGVSRIFLKTCLVVDLSVERPNGRFMSKFSLVVEVRLIKGKIDHPTFFKKYGMLLLRSKSCVKARIPEVP